MIANFLGKIFGSRNARILRRLNKMLLQINAFENTLKALPDQALQAKTLEFREKLNVLKTHTLDQLLPEAFAVVRETSRRVLGMRHFDVQMIGGIVLHEGKIAEMRTGEGKTLVATLAAYLNALPGQGVHIITINDYLAKRDAEWMKPIYQFLGLSVGVILSDMPAEDKRLAYQADITFGTNNEFGFDYLRDNMAFSLSERVQRHLSFAIVDEVDSILIDEARTPLIISGAAEDNAELYVQINRLIPQLNAQEDYILDEKARQVHFTEQGHQRIEELMLAEKLLTPEESLYDAKNITFMHHINAALRAHTLFHKDVDYIIQNNQIIIVDEHTGRTMPGRRWSDGIHQAVEAKENAAIQLENQTLASITFQNYFRLYHKLAGMTGTADTEAYEFQHIYGLEVVVIPTNQTVQRIDHPDQIYLSAQEKFAAVIADIKDCKNRNQPVLVGTASIETSEYLSSLLKQEKIIHQVLNAKFHEKEAQIIAEAGRPGSVTIATNMAGRGTDIVLGGKKDELSNEINESDDSDWQQKHAAVIASGGLHIIGSERHESRRIDNQLRGRAGRQGDPGSTRFYLSLEDNLMRIFAADRLKNVMQTLGMKNGEAITSALVTRAIESAQRKVESRNFDIRKQLLEYDDVANEQRKVIYTQRTELLASENISETIQAMRTDAIKMVVNNYIPPESLDEQWDMIGLEAYLAQDFGVNLPLQQWLAQDKTLHEITLKQKIQAHIAQLYHEKENQIGMTECRQLEKSVMLQQLDILWKEHLAHMDHLRQGIHLRGYAQKNPKQEYKREAFDLFTDMLETLKYRVTSILSRVQIQTQTAAPQFMDMSNMPDISESETLNFNHFNDASVGRNEPCPCGSEKKFKHCHGQLSLS